MADSKRQEVVISRSLPARLVRWRVVAGSEVREGSVLCFYEVIGEAGSARPFVTQPKLKSAFTGKVRKLLFAEGDIVPASAPVLVIDEIAECEHKMVMKDLCCDCGADLRKLNEEQSEPSSPTQASVPLIHNIPELKVSLEEAEVLGKKDEERLLQTRKLSLVVDLDQTLIHTTVELVPQDMEDVRHFQLPGHPMWYHTKIRPGTVNFLHQISNMYELHIFTMGSRLYAHTIARMLDPKETLFAYRIRSRDECFNAFSKSHDLRSLFPCGDSMVCIIDDREDVWNFAPNLVHVKPYQFFKDVGDINAPPGRSPPEESSPPERPAIESYSQEGNDMSQETSSQGSTESAGEEKASISENNVNLEENGNSGGNGTERATLHESAKASNKQGSQCGKEHECENIERRESTEKTVETLQNGGDGNETSEIKDAEPTKSQSDSDNSKDNERNNSGKVESATDDKTVDCKDQLTRCQKNRENDKSTERKCETAPVENQNGDTDQDDYLLHLEDILHRIHEVFYKTVDSIKSEGDDKAKQTSDITKYCSPGTVTPDTKVIVTSLRGDVLRGTNIVFTGVIPTSVKPEETQPWRIACALGAKVSNTVCRRKDAKCPSDVTTHVIAGRLGTQKLYRAIKTPGIKIVTPAWLWCCSERWEWVDERLFPVGGLEKYKQQIRDQDTPRGTPRGTPRETVERVEGNGSANLTSENTEANSTKTRSDSVCSADLLMSTLNPLLSFSPSEVEAMDKEVEDLMNDSGEESDIIGSVSDSSSSSASEDSEPPDKRKREDEGSRESEDSHSRNKQSRLDEDAEKSEDEQESNDLESDDYTHPSTPSDDGSDDDDDDDDMAAMLEAELTYP